MAEETTFTIGAQVSCADGICGEVTRVVIDPVARAVTHLVVEPTHRRGLGRLVPLDLLDAVTGEVRLRCTREEFDKLASAEETEFLPGTGNPLSYEPEETIVWPFFGLGMGLEGAGMAQIARSTPELVTYDSLPLGEVAVRRGQPVHTTDGEIGKVEGLVMSVDDHRVTHVLLQEGHLWGRKEVAIPIGAVAHVDGGIRLRITKEEVAELPAVEFHRPHG